MGEVQIMGTGSYVPERILTNNEMSKFIDTDDQWIRSRTGIGERRITTGENTSKISAKAAINALENAHINAEDLDLIIVATTTPDCYTPSTACIVQGLIGANKAVCFDISAACSGFIYALNIAYEFLKNRTMKNALIIGGETLSKILDWNDRGTCVLFGDGAGAAVLSISNEQGILGNYIASDGRGSNLLKCDAAPVDINNTILRKEVLGHEVAKSSGYLYMEGKEIFKFAVKVMEETIEKLLKETKLDIDSIDYIIPHQANLRIIDYTIKKLNIDKEKFYINLQNYGNTSAASIPIALDEMNRKGLLKKGQNILMVGFGGGLTWGGSIIKWCK
ncbi:beta-ketoacyl-ACP synthase III [uncultured Clostridium sp.]|uniref:beta-ketoacyl-ACP synthase III n=1 Tax=uncultured Clostridium sp. TaxID=59620 RepID=UPI0028EF7D35|nr:beta-ketoacyl-ACP synthase III [uncultured Clostridium sp.]